MFHITKIWQHPPLPGTGKSLSGESILIIGMVHGYFIPVGQSWNDGSRANIQEILVSIDNVRPKGTEEQYVTSTNVIEYKDSLRSKNSV